MATINFLDFIDGQLFRVIMDNHFNGLQVNVLTQQGRRTRYGWYGLRRTRFFDQTFFCISKRAWRGILSFWFTATISFEVIACR